MLPFKNIISLSLCYYEDSASDQSVVNPHNDQAYLCNAESINSNILVTLGINLCSTTVYQAD
jgi:hypothetical protein